MGCGAALRRKGGRLEGAAALRHDAVDSNTAGRAVYGVARDVDVDPVHSLHRAAFDIAEGVVADGHAVKGVVENGGVRADRAGHVGEGTVLYEDIPHIKILGAAAVHVCAVEDIELDRLIADPSRRKDLILEGAVPDGEAVNARDLHHMTLRLVANGHVFHGDIPRVSRLEHGIRSRAAVKGTASQGDVPVEIARHAAVWGIVLTCAQHIAPELARHGDARHIKRGIAENKQASAQVIAACRHLYSDGTVVRSEVLRRVERGLHRVRKASLTDLSLRYLNGLRGDFFIAAFGGHSRNGCRTCQHQSR